ncbi:hypothetical protein [Belnapia moabensis]|uniref:hypothetical protein n=1 Tax=Belnapia moabensis TaxID=365533 RepID=UPI0012EDEADF|nr:hypothetical protein [Belnapia moabensis]
MRSEELYTLAIVNFEMRPELYALLTIDYPNFISVLRSSFCDYRMILLFSFCGIFLLFGLGLIMAARQRAELRVQAAAMFQPPRSASVELGASLDEAERELGLLYRRMEAYLWDPYDFTRSRIRDDESFDRNLDFAVALNLHVAALASGVTQPMFEDRAQVRQQVLEALVRRVALQRRNVLHPGDDRRADRRSKPSL